MILLKMSNVYLPVSSVNTSLVPATCSCRWPLLVMPLTRAAWPVAARVTLLKGTLQAERQPSTLYNAVIIAVLNKAYTTANTSWWVAPLHAGLCDLTGNEIILISFRNQGYQLWMRCMKLHMLYREDSFCSL